MTASFHEKSVWTMLVALLLAFAAHVIIAGNMLRSGVMLAVPYLAILGVSTALLVLVAIVGHTIVAITGRNETFDKDERDRIIAWRAENNSSWLLGVGVIACIFALALQVESAWIANGLLASLYLSELLKHTLQLVYYRRGM